MAKEKLRLSARSDTNVCRELTYESSLFFFVAESVASRKERFMSNILVPM